MTDNTRQVPSAFFESLRTLGASCVALVGNRFELMVVEFREQQAYGKQVLLLCLASALLLSSTSLLLALWVVIVFWDTHRVLAITIVTLFYLLASLTALMQLYKKTANSPEPFAATLKEFSNDMSLFRPGDDSVSPRVDSVVLQDKKTDE
jgi:uncharacterized membrane protein YqjE